MGNFLKWPGASAGLVGLLGGGLGWWGPGQALGLLGLARGYHAKALRCSESPCAPHKMPRAQFDSKFLLYSIRLKFFILLLLFILLILYRSRARNRARKRAADCREKSELRRKSMSGWHDQTRPTYQD